MRQRRSLLPGLLSAVAIAALLSFAPSARAEDASVDAAWGDGVEVMADDDMAAQRGGLRIAPGLDVGFGAVVTTYANGLPALETRLTWTDTGAMVSQMLGQLGQSIDSLSPQQRTAMGLDGLHGVVISDADGVTALAHNVTDGSLQNIIINNATGRDLRQDVAVTLTLPAFDVMQGALDLERFGLRLDADMRLQLGH